MVTVTADDVRVLAQSNAEEPVLILAAGQVEVVPAAEADGAHIVYTKAELAEEYGVDLTDVEAQLAAAQLTSSLSAGDTLA